MPGEHQFHSFRPYKDDERLREVSPPKGTTHTILPSRPAAPRDFAKTVQAYGQQFTTKGNDSGLLPAIEIKGANARASKSGQNENDELFGRNAAAAAASAKPETSDSKPVVAQRSDQLNPSPIRAMNSVEPKGVTSMAPEKSASLPANNNTNAVSQRATETNRTPLVTQVPSTKQIASADAAVERVQAPAADKLRANDAVAVQTAKQTLGNDSHQKGDQLAKESLGKAPVQDIQSTKAAPASEARLSSTIKQSAPVGSDRPTAQSSVPARSAAADSVKPESTKIESTKGATVDSAKAELKPVAAKTIGSATTPEINKEQHKDNGNSMKADAPSNVRSSENSAAPTAAKRDQIQTGKSEVAARIDVANKHEPIKKDESSTSSNSRTDRSGGRSETSAQPHAITHGGEGSGQGSRSIETGSHDGGAGSKRAPQHDDVRVADKHAEGESPRSVKTDNGRGAEPPTGESHAQPNDKAANNTETGSHGSKNAVRADGQKGSHEQSGDAHANADKHPMGDTGHKDARTDLRELPGESHAGAISSHGDRVIDLHNDKGDNHNLVFEPSTKNANLDYVLDRMIDRLRGSDMSLQTARIDDRKTRQALADFISELEAHRFPFHRFNDSSAVIQAANKLGPEGLRELRALLTAKSDSVFEGVAMNKMYEYRRFIETVLLNVEQTKKPQSRTDKLKDLLAIASDRELYVVKFGQTLRWIAWKALNDASLWSLVAKLNGFVRDMTAPRADVRPTHQPKPGSRIMLPTAEEIKAFRLQAVTTLTTKIASDRTQPMKAVSTAGGDKRNEPVMDLLRGLGSAKCAKCKTIHALSSACNVEDVKTVQAIANTPTTVIRNGGKREQEPAASEVYVMPPSQFLATRINERTAS